MFAEGRAAGEFLELTQSFHSPAGQKGQKAQLARLQVFIGIEQVFQKALVLGEQAGLFIEGAASFSL